MKKYLAKRVFYMALTLFLVATITFFLMKLMPGTPYSNQEKMTPEQIQIMNQQYGLDKPVWMQYLKLGILPIADWGGFSYTVLPTIALGVGPLAETARFIRTGMVDVLNSDYIELARAKGLSKFQIVYHHALRNSLIPLITLIGPYTVSLMTGSMVIENIFSIPGIGEQFVKSITTNDYPTIMGVTMLFSAGLVAVILLTDIIYGIIDPRIRLAGNED